MCHYILIIFGPILLIISLGNTELFSGSMFHLSSKHTLYLIRQRLDIVNCVGIKSNDSVFLINAPWIKLPLTP